VIVSHDWVNIIRTRYHDDDRRVLRLNNKFIRCLDLFDLDLSINLNKGGCFIFTGRYEEK